jgi:hypothetical protein
LGRHLLNATRFDRRALLRAAAACAAGVLPSRAVAFGDTSRFIPAIGRHGGRWNTRPNALRRLCWEVSGRTSVEVFPEAHAVGLSSKELFRYPFLYLGGEGNFPAFSEDEVANLRRYLTYGGFLLADANDGSAGDSFDTSFRREIARVLPNQPLNRLPPEHVIFKSYYLLDRQGGRLLVRPFLEAIESQGRVAVVYSQNDLAGAWSRDEQGDWEYEVSPGGESQREVAIRTGVNLVMYALCLDYKEDAVHVPFIMKRRR